MPAKEAPSVIDIQLGISNGVLEPDVLYYVIEKRYIENHLSEISDFISDNELNIPVDGKSITSEIAKIFVHAKYGIDIGDCHTIAVSSYEPKERWGVAVPSDKLKAAGVELCDWDLSPNFVSRIRSDGSPTSGNLGR